MIEIDWSYGEGGGQILRTAVALSCVTGKSVSIRNIRKGRETPGLKHQHVESIHALAKLCQAKTTGVSVGSGEISFVPGPIKESHINIHIPTAGSIGLVLQGLLVAGATSKNPFTIEITGGSVSSKWAPPVEYVSRVLLQYLQKMGYDCAIQIKKYGYYPKGGAAVGVTIKPGELQPLQLTAPGAISTVHGISHASRALENQQVAQRQQQTAEKLLAAYHPKIQIRYEDTLSAGSGIELWCETSETILGASAIGEQKKRAEQVGEEAAKELTHEMDSHATVDKYAADQLLPYLALAAPAGESILVVSEITEHAKTNAWVIEQFLPVKFTFTEKKIVCKKL